MAASRRRKFIRLALGVFWLMAMAWLLVNMQAHGVGPAVFADSPTVRVTSTPVTLTFTPHPDTAAAALIFYPGALVDPDAYAPMARAVAEAGFAVVLVKLPLRLAPFDRQKTSVARQTSALIAGDEQRRAWVVGGHSRGGALAAQFVHSRAIVPSGLLLVGTSHPREDDLSGMNLDVTKIFGSADGLASEEEVHQFAPLLPPTTHWVRIAGGNHAQFGWYGWQLGDHAAEIPRAEQQRLTVEAIVGQLRRVADEAVAR